LHRCDGKAIAGDVIRTDGGVDRCKDCAERCWAQMRNCIGFNDLGGGRCTYFSSISSLKAAAGTTAVLTSTFVPKSGATSTPTVAKVVDGTKPPSEKPSGGKATRFLSWNVYYANLGAQWRVDGVAEAIKRVAPEIASIQEMWGEKPSILSKLRQITGQDWAFATGGETEKTWDGDILYRRDIWEELDSGMRAFGDRGLSWAALRRRSDGKGVLAYGTHPWCCTNDHPILTTMVMATKEMKERKKTFDFPVVFMGDMNADFNAASQRLVRLGSVNSHNSDWSVPITFEDSYAKIHPNSPNIPTIGNFAKIDFVYFENSPQRLGRTVASQVWESLPGGSDHKGVSGDVVIF